MKFFRHNPTKDKTYLELIDIVKKDGLRLMFIDNQTLELCIEAVKQNGLALQYVKEQTNDMCMEAIKQNPNSIKYAKEQTNDLCMYAVKQDGSTLLHIKNIINKPFDICLEAVNQNLGIIECIDYDKYENMYKILCNHIIEKIVVKIDSLEYNRDKLFNDMILEITTKKLKTFWHIPIKLITPKMYLCIVTKNPSMIKYIYCRHQTIEICKAALKQNPKLKIYVNPEFQNECSQYINNMNIIS